MKYKEFFNQRFFTRIGPTPRMNGHPNKQNLNSRIGDGDNKTLAFILVTREGDSLRGGHSTPSPQNPKPQNPFHERESGE